MAPAGSSLEGLFQYANNGTNTLQDALLSASQDTKDATYNELWHACAGKDVNLPRAGEKLIYFPQGHLEQVQSGADKESCPGLPPICNLPAEILCTAINVDLQVDSDEVFAQLTLLPDSEPQTQDIPKEILPSPPPRRAQVKYFSKQVTASDTSTHGGLSVLKHHADLCLPPLDMRQDPPAQELVAKDLLGQEWRFRHIFRGVPRRHLFTTGWGAFVSAKRIEAGDTFVFLRDENGEFHVGIRRSGRSRSKAAGVTLSSSTLKNGVMATVHYAISSGTIFSVYYWPRTFREFMIPVDRYAQSLKTKFSIGSRFRWKVNDEEYPSESLLGSIAAIEDADPVLWPESKWRCLKVHWSTPCSAMRPDRISPWDAELVVVTTNTKARFPHQHKRTRTPSQFVNHAGSAVLQGQETRDRGALEVGPSSGSCQPLRRRLEIHPRQNQSNALPTLNGTETRYTHGGRRFPPLTAYVGVNDSSQEPRAPDSGDLANASLSLALSYNRNTTCMLFGVDLISNTAKPVSAPASDVPLVGVVGSDQVANITARACNPTGSGSGSVTQCQRCSAAYGSYTKVYKHGNPIGRVVDLTKLNGYDELMQQLDEMFDLNGALAHKNGEWRLLYKDDEGDTMLVGDLAWGNFQCIGKKLIIYPKEEVEKNRILDLLNHSSPLFF